MNKTYIRIICAVLSLVIALGAAASCGISRNGSQDTAEDESQTQEITQEQETTLPDPDNYSPHAEAVSFEGVWHDKYSNKCDMNISHIGGNYYDISLRWGTICWSLLGTYSTEDGNMHYTGTEFELVLEDAPAADIIDGNCEGYFFFKEDDIKWSEREKCRFVYKDDSGYSDDFAKIAGDGEECATVYEDIEDATVAAVLPAGVTVNVIEDNGEYAEIRCCGVNGYIPSSQLEETGLAYREADFEVMWADELDGAEDVPVVELSDSYYAAEVAFVPHSPAADFKVLSLTFEDFDENNNPVYDIEEVYVTDVLDCPMIVTMSFNGSIPNNGISYVDRFGNTHRCTVSESGRDGSLILSEF